jgi:hypothetical protein
MVENIWMVKKVSRRDGKTIETTLTTAFKALEPSYYKTGTISEMMRGDKPFHLATSEFVYEFSFIPVDFT